MNPVVHFELPYKNADRISKFYQAVFGWELNDLGREHGGYILATTAKTDARPGMPSGTINGGFYPLKPDWPEQYPGIVIAVENIQDVMATIDENGGKVLGEPYEIPNFGKYVSFLDSEGNRSGMVEPNGMVYEYE